MGLFATLNLKVNSIMLNYKRFILLSLLIVLLILIGVYYFKPRVIKPTLVCALPIPNKSFSRLNYDNYEEYYDTYGFEKYYHSCDYVLRSKHLYYHLQPKWSKQKTGFDSITIQILDSMLDYTNNEYIIMWNQELIELHHSHYITNHREYCVPQAKRTPLCPICKNIDTDSIYIYSISKTEKFRLLGNW